jgi:hypothetical protein
MIQVHAAGTIFSGCTFFNSKIATSNAVEIHKDSAGDFRLQNVFSGCRWESGGINFANAIAFFDETGAAPANAARFGTVAVGCVIDSGTAARTNLNLGTVNNGNFMRLDGMIQTNNSTSQPITLAGWSIGTQVFSGTGAQTAFVVTHNMGEVPLVFVAVGQSAACTPIASVTALSSTQATVTFSVAPANAANNVTIAWYAHN